MRFSTSAAAAQGCVLAGGGRHRRVDERSLSLPCRRTWTTMRCRPAGSWCWAGFTWRCKANSAGLYLRELVVGALGLLGYIAYS